MPRARGAVVLALAMSGLLAGCAIPGPVSETAGGQPLEAEASPEAEERELSGSIRVNAASSMSVVLPTIVKAFREEVPGARVDVTYGASSDLANAIVAGDIADAFIAASERTMGTVVEAGYATTAPHTIARNRLEIAVPGDNPGDITGLEDFGDEDKTVVVCAEQVPCGAAAQQVFEAAGIEPEIDSFERDVTSVLTKVRLGEADAGLVYHTDVEAAADGVRGIQFPEAEEAITSVQIAALDASENPELALAFVEFMEGEEAAEFLLEAGFLAAAEE